MNKKFSVSLTLIFCALIIQAQSGYAQEPAPPDTTWDADPLDVLEPKKQESAEPTVPEFKEIPASGVPDASVPAASAPAVHDVDVPKNVATPEHAEIPAPPAPEILSEPKSEPAQQAESSPALAPSGRDSEPDYNKEAHFHEVYKRYNEQPTSEEVWEKAAGARKSEVYRVQKGNTLWDISNTFFGDPNFWPKIWSLNNDSILNPHEINPAMSVRFYPGTMADAPTLAVGAAESEKDKVVASNSAEKEDRELVQKTARRRTFTPVLKTLPSSLPKGTFNGLAENSNQVQIQFQASKFPVGIEYLSYYISEAPVEGVGVVTGTEMDMKTAGDFQYVYVKLDNANAKSYVAQKNMGDVVDPVEKSRKAQMVEVQGSVEILEKVNEQKGIYRALVKKAIMPVEVGAVLLPGNLPIVDPTPSAVTNSTGAKIMGGQLGKGRGLFTANSLVFLDAGSSRGLQEGQSLAIYADEAIRNKQTDAVINDRQIGVLKIVKVSSGFATAYVTKCTDDILLGDYVGSASARTAVNKAVSEESHVPESRDQIDTELELQGAPSTEPPPESGTEDLDLEL
ncbi:MAG: LysM peptidoglycan-binding domain-containing protein [Bacillota bacterium]